MLIYPAIDLFDGKAVRLYKGDYRRMTVYSENPRSVAEDFVRMGATRLHLVDLQGAKSGSTDNFETIRLIRKDLPLFTELGGGIRDMDTVSRYLDLGIDRVILGTAAVSDPAFAERAAAKYGDAIAVGADIRDGFVAIRGWTEKSSVTAVDFCVQMQNIGIRTLISTDISRDGAMKGTNHALYRELASKLTMDVIASGGVSTVEDVLSLREIGVHGAIIGKAYYTGAIDLKEAIEAAK